MKIIACIVLIVFSFIFGYFLAFNKSVYNYQKLVNSYTPTPTPKPLDDQLFNLVQRWRYDNYLRPYTKSDFLCDIAKDRSNDDFSHDGFLAKYGDIDGLAENLAIDYYSSQSYLDAWLSSPSHRKNLDAPYTHSCIKCDIQCVQIFGYR